MARLTAQAFAQEVVGKVVKDLAIPETQRIAKSRMWPAFKNMMLNVMNLTKVQEKQRISLGGVGVFYISPARPFKNRKTGVVTIGKKSFRFKATKKMRNLIG